MHTHAQTSFGYFGEQSDLTYASQARPQDALFWSQDIYNTTGAQWAQNVVPPAANAWTMGDQNTYSTPFTPTYSTSWGAMAQGSPYTTIPRQTYLSTSATQAQELSRWQAPQNPVAIHTYERLPSAEKGVVDAWLEKDTERRVYRCRGSGCGKEFSSKDNARVHVHGKHLGENKLFRCVQCRTEFASEDGAKRHRDTATSKTFSCPYCSNTYARKDYRDLHQKKCTSRANY